MRFCLALPLLLVAGCGGSEPRAAAESAPPPAKAEEGHGGLSPELHAFHETLAPRWHAAPSAERTEGTCGAIAEFQTRAAAIKAASPPAGASPEAWSQAGGELETSVAGLDTACRAGDAAGFESAFSAVHDAFHRAMETASGGHGEHHGAGGHEHP